MSIHRAGRSSSKPTSIRRAPRSKKRWIQHALRRHKKGALHRDMRIPVGQVIPFGKLEAHIRRLRRQLIQATGKRRARIRSKLARARLGLRLKVRTSVRSLQRAVRHYNASDFSPKALKKMQQHAQLAAASYV